MLGLAVAGVGPREQGFPDARLSPSPACPALPAGGVRDGDRNQEYEARNQGPQRFAAFSSRTISTSPRSAAV